MYNKGTNGLLLGPRSSPTRNVRGTTEMILTFSIFTTLLALSTSESVQTKIFDINQVYYDLDDNPVPQLDFNQELSTGQESTLLKNEVTKFGFLPCSCEEDYNCGCCANFRFIQFARLMCSNFTYDPKEFSIRMDMNIDGESVLNRTVSAKNPPPACIPMPYLPAVRLCLKLFDVYTPGRNLHMCINFETKFVTAPVLVLEFDCIQMGSDGFMHGKPSELPQRNNSTDDGERLLEFETTTFPIDANYTLNEDYTVLNNTVSSDLN